MMEDFNNEEKRISAVARTITILEALSKSDSVNLETLSSETGLPKATLLRFLTTLSSLGYVSRDDGDLYHLTLKMFSVGSRSLQHMELINTAIPFTRKLRNTFGEAVHMGIMQDENSAVYVIKEESPHSLRMYSRVGKTIPLYCTAMGKNFLASMSKERLEDYLLHNELVPLTKNSIRSKEEMMKELQTVKEQGWAMDNEENEMDIICLGVPIKDYTGETIAAISVSWPVFRFNKEKKEEIIHVLKETALELSTVLGYMPE